MSHIPENPMLYMIMTSLGKILIKHRLPVRVRVRVRVRVGVRVRVFG